MNSVLARPFPVDSSLVLRSRTGARARGLAMAFLRNASACWRGDPRAEVFAAQLFAYAWSDQPPIPTLLAAAVSPHGGGGRGIHWYQTDDEVVGYIPGTRSGYRVPQVVVPRLVRGASAMTSALPLDNFPLTTADARVPQGMQRP